ncbi:MAG: TraB domain-containing protein, partial [Deltaproteobacteria bacterium]
MKHTDTDFNIHHLHYQDKEITLVGTAHVSRESADLVREVIAQEKPETVCVELCQSRYQSLTQKKLWQDTNLIKVIRGKKAFLLLANLMLASFQKRIGKKLGIQPGQEIIQAIDSAKEAGAEIHLADRDIRITLGRTWRLMGFWKKIKLLSQFIISLGQVDDITQEEIEKLKERDVLETLLSEIG